MSPGNTPPLLLFTVRTLNTLVNSRSQKKWWVDTKIYKTRWFRQYYLRWLWSFCRCILDLLLTKTCSLKYFRSTQGNQGSTLVAPVPNGQILDDSGIGTSIRQLKQYGGLPSQPNPGNGANGQIQENNSPNHDKDNETEKEKEKEKVLNNIPVTVSDVSDDETNDDTNPKTLHATISSQYESLLDTPPDSLLGHIPVTVLDKAAESFNSLRSNSSSGSSGSNSGSGGGSSGDKTSKSGLSEYIREMFLSFTGHFVRRIMSPSSDILGFRRTWKRNRLTFI